MRCQLVYCVKPVTYTHSTAALRICIRMAVFLSLVLLPRNGLRLKVSWLAYLLSVEFHLLVLGAELYNHVVPNQ